MASDAEQPVSASDRVLGIDGGGTKTEWALLAGDGSILQSGVLPPANLRLISDDALARMFDVLPGGATHVGAFLAGCADEADRGRLRRLVEIRWPEARVAVGSDRASAFATAFGHADGITVIAGTGSAVTGRRAGKIEKAGGWGQLLGDRGGGYNLAVQALRRVLSDYDIDQRVDALGQSILRLLCLNRLEDLVGWATTADKTSVAMLAPVVFEAANNGHKEMREALESAAQMLAAFTAAVAKRLGLEAPNVKLSGGLFVHHPEYAALFAQCLAPALPNASVSVGHASAAFGAAWLAARGMTAPLSSAAASRFETQPSETSQLASAATEQRNARSTNLEQQSTAELVQLFVREEDEVPAALAGRADELVRAVDLVSAALRQGGRLFYVGAGTSGRLGVLDASEIPPTFGAPPELVQGVIAGGARALHLSVEGAEDQAEAGALAIVERGVGQGDVVCGITASGRTPFVLAALRRARELGARTILLTCNPRRVPADGEEFDVAIDLPTGAEIVTGSTRLKAGTATKVALNIISTCSMIRLGKVRGNLMIDVNASNAKLRDRATRLVCELRGCSYDDARALLERSNWNVRAAVAG
jgi:N-acetylmuramic acid 6-phosphate etherase